MGFIYPKKCKLEFVSYQLIKFILVSNVVMVVTKDRTIAVTSANGGNHHRLLFCLFICFNFLFSGFAAETRYKGKTRRKRRNKFVLDEQQRTLKYHCPLPSSASNQSAEADGESQNNYIYRRMYSRTANI